MLQVVWFHHITAGKGNTTWMENRAVLAGNSGLGVRVDNKGEQEELLLWWNYSVMTVMVSVQISSVQFCCSFVSDSSQHHGLQHARPPCPSPTPGVYSNSSPLSWWYHPAISSSVIPFSSCLQTFPASGSFSLSQFFTSGGQDTVVSASASYLPMNIQDWFPLGWTGWISLQSKGLSRVFSDTTVKSISSLALNFLSEGHTWLSHIHTWLLEKPQPWVDGPLLVK